MRGVGLKRQDRQQSCRWAHRRSAAWAWRSGSASPQGGLRRAPGPGPGSVRWPARTAPSSRAGLPHDPTPPPGASCQPPAARAAGARHRGRPSRLRRLRPRSGRRQGRRRATGGKLLGLLRIKRGLRLKLNAVERAHEGELGDAHPHRDAPLLTAGHLSLAQELQGLAQGERAARRRVEPAVEPVAHGTPLQPGPHLGLQQEIVAQLAHRSFDRAQRDHDPVLVRRFLAQGRRRCHDGAGSAPPANLQGRPARRPAPAGGRGANRPGEGSAVPCSGCSRARPRCASTPNPGRAGAASPPPPQALALPIRSMVPPSGGVSSSWRQGRRCSRRVTRLGCSTRACPQLREPLWGRMG